MQLMMRRFVTTTVLAALVLGAQEHLGAQDREFDILIRNGRVIDGTGNLGFDTTSVSGATRS